jgi:hypothetical protein
VILYANNVEVKSFIISMDDNCMQFEVHTVDGEKRVIESAWCKAVMDNPQEIILHTTTRSGHLSNLALVITELDRK